MTDIIREARKMHKFACIIAIGVLASVIALAQTAQKQEQVEIEQMTYPEIHSAIHDRGKTTVLIYNGGTEQRGPHAVLGGRSLITHKISTMIAKKLGNALVAPV